MAEEKRLENPRRVLPKVWRKGALTLKLVHGRDLCVCDLMGKSDPYGVIKWLDADGVVIGKPLKTQVIDKNLNPDWNFSIIDGEIEPDWKAEKLLIEIWDKDKIGSDDFMGQIIMNKEAIIEVDNSPWKLDKEKKLKLEGRPGKSDKHVTGEILIYVSYDSPEMKEALAAYNAQQKVLDEKKREEDRIKKEHRRANPEPYDLFEATGNDDVEEVKRLLALGVSPDSKSQYTGSYAIHMALGRNNKEIVKLLVDAGCNLDLPDDEGRSCWYCAGYNKSLLQGTEYYEAHNSADKKKQLESAQKKADDAKYRYCLATGLTGYEPDFEQRMYRDSLEAKTLHLKAEQLKKEQAK